MIKRILCITLFLSLFLSSASAGEQWPVLTPGWWDAPREKLAPVTVQLEYHLRQIRGEPVELSALSDSSSRDDWSILKPGWWNAPAEEIQNALRQLSDYMDVLDGKLVVVGTKAAPDEKAESAAGFPSPESVTDGLSASNPSSSVAGEWAEPLFEDPQAYHSIDFSSAFGNAQFEGQKIILEGIVIASEQTGPSPVLTIRASERQLWIVHVPGSSGTSVPSENERAVVLGRIHSCTEYDSTGNQMITVEADYVEKQ